jgi:hypothetical protein
VPWQREQAARVRPLVRAGLCRLVAPDAQAMLGAVREWIAQPVAVGSMRERMTRAGITNGLADAATALRHFLGKEEG